MPKTSDVGVIVGRFQVHQLHAAHLALIQSIYDTHRQTVIVLGLSPVRVTIRNPLDFEARKQMLVDAFPKATVLYLKDQPTDIGWSAALDHLIRDYVSPAQSVCLYGGRDSFIAHYTGKHKTDVLEPERYLSGTELRGTIARGVRASEDFRAGVIWASANSYPKTFPTVDVAIWRVAQDALREIAQDHSAARAAHEGREWLLVRKQNETKWRFPGGFVDPTDKSLETAARREVSEEVGVSIGDPTYIASKIIDDWRYRHEVDKIMTSLFIAKFVSGPIRPADDVVEAQWFQESARMVMSLVDEHVPLWSAFMDWEVASKGGAK